MENDRCVWQGAVGYVRETPSSLKGADSAKEIGGLSRSNRRELETFYTGADR